MDERELQNLGDGTQNNPFIISDVEGLNRIRNNLSAFYRLVKDIDCEGSNITPIGTNIQPFKGGFDGDGYSIKNLKISTGDYYVGLFRIATNAIFKKLTLHNIEIKNTLSSIKYTGALAGNLLRCQVEDISLINSTVIGWDYTGGIAGGSTGGSFKNCTIKGSSQVSGNNYVGGLIGEVVDSLISYCCSNIKIKGSGDTGGLVGKASGKASIEKCYTTGEVIGGYNVGGIIGHSLININNSFSVANVTSKINNTNVGGLTGYCTYKILNNCYTAGAISKNGNGLVYVDRLATVNNCYFDSMAAGNYIENEYNKGKLTSGLMKKDLYTDWDFETIWDIEEGSTYPYLRGMEMPENIEKDISLLPKGAGTVEDPYSIENVSQFDNIRYDVTGCYQLVLDLDFQGETIIPIGTLIAPFKGKLDGNGHIITNFKIETMESYTGLFRVAQGAIFKHLTIQNAEIIQKSTFSYIGTLAGNSTNCMVENIALMNIKLSGGKYAGALAGYVSGGNYKKCSINGNALINGTMCAGGLIGEVINTTLYYCYSTAEVAGTDCIGGLIGKITGTSAKIAECYAISKTMGNKYVGGLVGYAIAEISNSFSIGSAISSTNDYSAGGLLGYMSNAQIINCYAACEISSNGSGLVSVIGATSVINSYFDSIAAKTDSVNGYNVAKLTVALIRKGAYTNWNFENIWDIEEGSKYPYLRAIGKPEDYKVDISILPTGIGTQEEPYIIKNAEQFEYIKYDIGGYYRLAADIDLNGQEIIPAGTLKVSFTGGLDGNGYSIKNLRISTSDSNTGIFRVASGAHFKNILIENADIKQPSTQQYIGALAGQLINCNTENISLSAVTVSGGSNAGALAGYINQGILSDCSTRGNIFISGTSIAGGLAGFIMNAEVNKCRVLAMGKITASDSVGGMFGGASKNTISQCNATIEASGNNYVGGLIGWESGGSSLKECYAAGNVTGNFYLGGLVGKLNGNICDSFALGNVISRQTHAYTGGLVGHCSNTTIKNSYAAGEISTKGSGLAYVDRAVIITDSYFDSTLSRLTAPTTQARTTEQMFHRENYGNWDWENIWKGKESDYPDLKNITDASYQIPMELTLQKLRYDSINLNWPKIENAEEYEVLYFDTVIKTNTSEIIIEEIIPDTDYEFRVRAKVGNEIGAWSKPLEIKTKPVLLLEGVHCTIKDNSSITIEWNALEEAEIYEAICNGKIQQSTVNTCTITGLTEDISYPIYIRALISDGSIVTSRAIIEKLYMRNPQTEYANEFIEKCEGQTWFMDEIENILNTKGKSINTISSKEDFSTIYALDLANRGISGKKPTAIEELFALKYLNLTNNELSN